MNGFNVQMATWFSGSSKAPISDYNLWVRLDSCIQKCIIDPYKTPDNMFMGKNKHAVFDHCLSIYEKYDKDNIDPKRVFDCIQKNIFYKVGFPDSQVILGFFYVAYLRYAKLMPDPRPKSSDSGELQKQIQELVKRVEEIETMHKEGHAHVTPGNQWDDLTKRLAEIQGMHKAGHSHYDPSTLWVGNA